MKYLSLIPLAGLAIAAPGSNWNDDPVAAASSSAAASTWADQDLPVTVTETNTATGTYCPKSGKYTKPAPDNNVAYCTYDVTEVTVTQATATVTVTQGGKGGNGGNGGYPGGPGGPQTVTVTSTVTQGGNSGPGGKVTVTETVTSDCSYPTGGNGGYPGKCLSQDAATTLVNNFINLLEYTSFKPSASRPGVPGRGYNMAISNATLDPAFVDISDSINMMAGFPLGSVTFPNKAAFDYGQGVLQPEVKVETLNIFVDCKAITWRWKITPITGTTAYPVVGINYMKVNEKGLLIKNYAEFDNAAWISSFGPQAKCGQNNITVVSGPFATK